MSYKLSFNLDNTNQSAAMLYQCNGSGTNNASTLAYSKNGDYYVCPLCYTNILTEGLYPQTSVNNLRYQTPYTKSLYNLPQGSDGGIVQEPDGSYTWTTFDPETPMTTNEKFTLWCHMYNLCLDITNGEPLSLYPSYQTTLQNLMNKYLESLQYNNVTATNAMLLSHAKMFNLMNSSSNKKCNSAFNNYLSQKQTRILLDDVYDYNFVSYNNNASIQQSNVQEFVLTKTLLRFLELLNLTLINPDYNLDWIIYNTPDEVKTISQTNGVSPFDIVVNTSILLVDGIIQLEEKNYFINNKSTSCIISFLSSFGSLQ